MDIQEEIRLWVERNPGKDIPYDLRRKLYAAQDAYDKASENDLRHRG